MDDRGPFDRQREHWQHTFAANPDMYGTAPSESGQYALDLCISEHLHHVLELGTGQGRDTLAFLASGLHVTALDYESESLRALHDQAVGLGEVDQLEVISHDVRQPLPSSDASFDAVYSHMLFNMALTTDELDALAAEVGRVLRPGALHVYTVRHVGDAHFGSGITHGDNVYENGGFIVHFFDRELVDRLATGFDLLELHEFEEGELPRRLWRVTLRRRAVPDAP
jgi:SAM-dependent methyltransferase